MRGRRRHAEQADRSFSPRRARPWRLRWPTRGSAPRADAHLLIADSARGLRRGDRRPAQRSAEARAPRRGRPRLRPRQLDLGSALAQARARLLRRARWQTGVAAAVAGGGARSGARSRLDDGAAAHRHRRAATLGNDPRCGACCGKTRAIAATTSRSAGCWRSSRPRTRSRSAPSSSNCSTATLRCSAPLTPRSCGRRK